MTCTEIGHLTVVAVMTSKVYFLYQRHDCLNDQVGVLFSTVEMRWSVLGAIVFSNFPLLLNIPNYRILYDSFLPAFRSC